MKTPQDSKTESWHLARPGNANTLGTVFGGDLLQLMDEAAAICARRHSGLRVVTKTIEDVQFYRPIEMGQVIRVTAEAVRVYKTSMEVQLNINGLDSYQQGSFHAARARFIIVCTDEQGRPAVIPALEPVTDEEKQRWKDSGERRKQRTDK